MLDVNLLRNQPDVVVEGLAKRGYTLDLSDFTAWDAERRSLLSENESLKAERNRLNKEIPAMKKRGGYIPTCDHGVPEEVPFENYIHFRKRLNEFSD